MMKNILINYLVTHYVSRGVARVAFEVLIIKSEIDFINLFIFNCLTSNINLFNFSSFSSNFCFPKNIFFASRRERMFMDVPLFYSGFQLNRENNDLLSSRHKQTFEVPHHVHKHTKLKIPVKRYRTNTAQFF